MSKLGLNNTQKKFSQLPVFLLSTTPSQPLKIKISDIAT